MPTLLFNKPFNVLSQFTDGQGRATLADYIDVPGVYAAGRLDRDSEGLLVLTSDNALKSRLMHPRYKEAKRYLAQVEGVADAAAIKALQRGVRLKDGMAYAEVRLLGGKPGWLWARKPPIRYRRNVPTSRLELTISEGRNRQVRRMGAAVNLPVLRLVRLSVGGYQLGDIAPGSYELV